MVLLDPDTAAGARYTTYERILLDDAALFLPGLTLDVVTRRAVGLLAGTLGDAAFLLADDAPSWVTSFADAPLCARWEAAHDPALALLDAARAATAPLQSVVPEPSLGALGLHGWYGTPLHGRTGRVGTLALARIDTPLAPGELSLLRHFAGRIAVAFDYTRLDRAAQRHKRDTALLAEVGALFDHQTHDPETLSRTIAATVDLIGQALGERCALYLVEQGQTTLYLADIFSRDLAEREERRATLHARPPRLGEGAIGRVAAGGAAELLADAATIATGGWPVATSGLGSWLCAPLRDGARILGVLTLGRDPGDCPLDGDELTLIGMIAGRIAATLARIAQAEQATTYRGLVEGSPDPAFTLGLNGRVLGANAAMCEVMDCGIGRLLGRHISDLLAIDKREETLELLAGAIISGQPGAAREWTFVRPSGGRRLVEVRTHILTELGQPVEVQCAGRDLTARREQQRALERQVTELTTLHSAGLTLADTREPTEIQQALLGAIRAAIPCDDVTVYTLDGAIMQPALALLPGMAPTPDFPHGHPLTDWSVQHGQSALVNDASSDPEFGPLLGLPMPRHLLIVPLLTGGQARGCVVLRRKAGELFTLNDLRLVESIAAQASMTLHNARLHAETSGAATDLRAVLESIEQGIIMTDQAGRVRFANRRLGELLGLEVRALIGRPMLEMAEELIAPQTRDPNGLLARLAWLETHPEETSTDEIAFSRTLGRILEHYSGPMRDPDSGATVGRIIVYSDVTEERQLQRAKDEFLATASHELKTPITTLGGYLELLERQVALPAGPDPVRLTRYVGTARGELQRLHRLSEDLLMVTRIEAGRLALRPEPGDLALTTRDAVERFVRRPGLQERGHRILCETSESLPTLHDTLRIGQVLDNLLENALKYSPEGGEVTVAATRTGTEALLSVRDTGIGVPADERERLFLPFYRTSNASAGSTEGLGLGLYISRGIIEGHGGRIWIEPAPGHGSVFCVALPLMSAEREMREAE